MAGSTGKQEDETSWQGFGRVFDYLFGRNALIGLASLMLLVISGYATWSGMNDFIVGVSTSPAAQGREIVGGMSVTNEILVIAIVVALTFLMWLALRETFAVGRTLRDRFLTFPLYLFLALWSIGFGYGFWWSLIAGEEATKKSLAGLQEDARDAGAAISARLAAVKIQLDSVVQWSDSQMAREETSGGSCGISSGAGRGPLYNARRSVRDSVTSLRDSIQTSWIKPVEEDLAKLRNAASGLAGATVAERQENFEAKARTLRGSARSIAERSNQLGRSTAAEMQALANAVAARPGSADFSCYDPTLAQRLRQASRQAAEPAALNLRPALFTEGPAGVANAVKTMWANIGTMLTGGVRLITGGSTTPADPGADESISGRDLIALLATLGIDIGLFVLTALNPPRTPPHREIPPPLKRRIVSAIRTAIHRAPKADWEWIRRHVLHHNKASYFVIPNLYSADEGHEGERERALAMNQLAGVLEDLKLIRELKGSEWSTIKKDEQRESHSDLTQYQAQWRESGSDRGEPASEAALSQPKRNHGLLSKSAMALAIAEWSEKARSDVEIFTLVDQDGLTPLLSVLTDPGEALTASEHQLPVADARLQYLGALATGARTNPSAVRVFEKILDAKDEFADNLRDFYKAWPKIAQAVTDGRPTIDRDVPAHGEQLTQQWAADENVSYPLTRLPRTDLENAVVTFWTLRCIRDELRDAAQDSNEKVESAHLQAIASFLDPADDTPATAAIKALKALTAAKGSAS